MCGSCYILFSNELLTLLPDTGCLHCLAMESLGLILNQQRTKQVLVHGVTKSWTRLSD